MAKDRGSVPLHIDPRVDLSSLPNILTQYGALADKVYAGQADPQTVDTILRILREARGTHQEISTTGAGIGANPTSQKGRVGHPFDVISS